MSAARSGPYGQQAPTASRRTSTTLVNRPDDTYFDAGDSAGHGGDDDHILVHFNGHFNGQFNGAFVVPNTALESMQGQSDAQIAARRAMSKRNSRSFAGRISRQKSRKREILGRPVKPGITVDTSFTRHRGNAPHQVYPHDRDARRSKSFRKDGWLGLGRSSTKTKGLGIMKGTPQPESQFGDNSTPRSTDPKTADSLTPGSRTWQEISPWDRPIPIGITVPSDSLPSFSPYQSTRQRSGSDTTLVTPNIIITPAEAFKSVWSPDTASDYTPIRASSIYSRATFFPGSAHPDVPPVPALPVDFKGSQEKPAIEDDGMHTSHTRNDTLDSTDTAFEEEDDYVRHKDRINSTATVFEEDEVPLRGAKAQSSALTIDTSLIPTPRRSQGWWNFITTPFMMSRANSVWTQNDKNGQRTPDIPAMPNRSGVNRESPSTPSTYIWTATEKGSPLPGDVPDWDEKAPREFKMMKTLSSIASPGDNASQKQSAKTSPSYHDMASPLSALSASPVVGTAAIGTILMPRHVDEHSQTNENFELQDRRANVANILPTNISSQAASRSANGSPPTNTSPQPIVPPLHTQQTLPVFAPPPTTEQKASHFSYEYSSRPSTPSTTQDLKQNKLRKKHRRVTDMMSFLQRGVKRGEKENQPEKKKKKRGLCFWCCGCCILILVLIAIIVPVVVVVVRRQNNNDTTPDTSQPPAPDAPSQWLNLTGYPPIPTGVSTIAQPEAVEEEDGCVAPTTLWSCAVPKEQQQSISPNKPDQPNFKLEIVFENGTVADPSKTQPVKRAANPVSVGAFMRSRFLNVRAAPSASPAPPSIEDMEFLGNTTDGVEAPFEGEDTPFFISFRDAAKSTSKLIRRADPDDPTNITDIIPPPLLNSDGTAAPANLYPFPSNQPLRLYNRGKADEHYGFYTYFDRAIFLKNTTSQNDRGGNPADQDGGSTFDAANMRCTFSDTRFLVQIWTQSEKTKPLLQSSTRENSEADLNRPGSFPYPVTITLDRHGGTFTKKMIYCYSMESDGTIKNESSKKFFQVEDRGFGGNLANPTNGFVNTTGPIDGGSGGCRCAWQNWLN
ncbi:hypothetical protein BS50DRAFT_501059 [Corynespora cassiicola Philippines]|uniref:Glycoprotease family protein n=1 Tax=Corynespora cassiicola Philippines TaxID=1448308 RepID=A0A2T2ND61_CORCC|nr:hypothetical protein BS50DRAFT_501059 [Corynespora cassiicola Philippines]